MTLTALAVAALLLVPGASAAGICPSGLSGSGFVMGSSCYEFVVKQVTWVTALSECHSRGGRLAAVTSANIQTWISSQAATIFKGYQGVWLGLNDRKTEGSYVWDNYDGKKDFTSGYTNWYSGEPNDFFFGQDCVYMRRSYAWQWVDIECNLPAIRQYCFICEYSTVPPAVTSTPTVTTMATPSPSSSLATTVVPSRVRGTNAAENKSVSEMHSSTVLATTTFTRVAAEHASSPFSPASATNRLAAAVKATDYTAPGSSSFDSVAFSNSSTPSLTTEELTSSRISAMTRAVLSTLRDTTVNQAADSASGSAMLPTTNFVTTVTEIATKKPSSAFNVLSETTGLAAEQTATERTEPLSSTYEVVQTSSSVATKRPITPLSSLLPTSSYDGLHGDVATTDTAAISATSTSLWQPPESNDTMHVADPGHIIQLDAEKAGEPQVGKSYQDSSAKSTSEPDAPQVASKGNATNAATPIYLGVISIAILGAIVTAAMLVRKAHTRRQQRPTVGIENPLYGTTLRPPTAI